MEIITNRKHSIVYYSYILLFIVLFFYGLYHARSFLIPVSLAALFSMLLWPVSRFLERKGVSRAGAAGICVFILILFLLVFVFFFASQIANFSSQMGNLQNQIMEMVEQFKSFLQNKFGINTQNFFSTAESGGGAESGANGGSGSMSSGSTSSGTGTSPGSETSGANANQGSGSGGESNSGTNSGGSGGSGNSESSGKGSAKSGSGSGLGIGSESSGKSGGTGDSGSAFSLSSYISNIVSGIKTLAMVTFKTLIGIIIISVYVFLMLLYRHIFINFVRKVSPQKQEAENVSRQVANVSKQYLAGRLIVIGIVAVINSVGLTLIGIKQGIFFGVLAALLDLIPYIGVIIGAGLPLIMSIINHQSWWPFFAVLGLFVFVQLLENYFLTPKIVGSKVRLNPLFTLMAVLVGGYIWGVAGMILFIPFLGMLKIVFDHIEALHPYGYLIGDPESRTEKK